MRGEAGSPQNHPRDPIIVFFSGLSGFSPTQASQRVPKGWAAAERVWSLLTASRRPTTVPRLPPHRRWTETTIVCMYVCVCGRSRPPAARRGGRCARVPKIPNYKCSDLDPQAFKIIQQSFISQVSQSPSRDGSFRYLTGCLRAGGLFPPFHHSPSPALPALAMAHGS